MKKIMIFTITMVFALAVGTVYGGMGIYGAKEGDHAVMFNGITNFSGKGYDTTSDTLKIDAADWDVARGVAEVEGSSAGGLRAGEMEELHPYNGITNFSGKGIGTTSDALKIGPADWGGAVRSPVEGASAGGLRAGEMELHPYNGVTDFSGRSYDVIPEAFSL